MQLIKRLILDRQNSQIIEGKLKITVPTFNSCTKCLGSPGTTQNRTPDCQPTPGIDAWMTSQLNVALNCKLSWSLMSLDYLFEKLSMGVCTTRHWQMSSRLVQELNVCTVDSPCSICRSLRIVSRRSTHLNIYIPGILKEENKISFIR